MKYLQDLQYASARARALRRIEQTYWRERGVRFLVANEEPFTSRLADRMMWAIDGMRFAAGQESLQRFLAILDAQAHRQPLRPRLALCGKSMKWTTEEATRAFKFALLTGRWRARDEHQSLDMSVPWPGRTVRNFTARRANTARLALS